MIMMNDHMRRMPAEWERHGAVLLAMPHDRTDWAYMLPEVTECYRNVNKAISLDTMTVVVTPSASDAMAALGDGVVNDNVRFVEIPTNDTWARDFGPLTVVDFDGNISLLDFQFNGWGLKFAACEDNLITSRMNEAGLFSVPVENHRGFVLEGGSVESDGHGIILTTSECLMSPNRNAAMSKDDIEHYLKSALGAEKILWLDHGALEGDDTDSHIDTLCRLAPDNVILYTGTARTDDVHYAGLRAMREQLAAFTDLNGAPFSLIELPLPDAVHDAETGERLPPTYGQPLNDRLAADTLRVAYPEHEVVTIDCRALIRQHGSLHCITMQLPVKALNL